MRTLTSLLILLATSCSTKSPPPPTPAPAHKEFTRIDPAKHPEYPNHHAVSDEGLRRILLKQIDDKTASAKRERVSEGETDKAKAREENASQNANAALWWQRYGPALIGTAGLVGLVAGFALALLSRTD